MSNSAGLIKLSLDAAGNPINAEQFITFSGVPFGIDFEPGTLDLQADQVIDEGMVYELTFDGTDLTIGEPEPNSMITLEGIYDAVTRLTPTPDS